MDDSAITVPGRQIQRHPPPQHHHHHQCNHDKEPDGEDLGALQVVLLPLAAGPAATVAEARAPASDADRHKDDADGQQVDDDGDDDYDDARSLPPEIYN